MTRIQALSLAIHYQSTVRKFRKSQFAKKRSLQRIHATRKFSVTYQLTSSRNTIIYIVGVRTSDTVSAVLYSWFRVRASAARHVTRCTRSDRKLMIWQALVTSGWRLLSHQNNCFGSVCQETRAYKINATPYFKTTCFSVEGGSQT